MLVASDQVIVSGKLRAQRAKSMKFKDGYMISSGQPVNEYIDSAVRHVLLRQVHSIGFKFLKPYKNYLFILVCYCDSLSDHIFYCYIGGSWYQGQDHAGLGS